MVTRHGGLGRCYIRSQVVVGFGGGNQHRSTEDDLKILLRILSVANITSLIHTRHWPIYAWTLIYTSRVRTATSFESFGNLLFELAKHHLPTPKLRFFVSVNSRLSNTWCRDIPMLVLYHSRNFPRSGYMTGRTNLSLHWTQSVALLQFGDIGGGSDSFGS